MNNQSKRIPSLDGIRAVSITIVVLSHIWYSFGYPDKFYLTGNLGVRIFFVISGFLITSILINELKENSTINLKRFYLRRTFRIFPAYYFYILVILAFSSVFNLFSSTSFLISLTYTTNYFFTQVPRELEHFWSLAIEEQFYLIFPGILVVYGLKDFKKILLILLVLSPCLRYLTTLYPTPIPELQFLRIGWNFHTNIDVLATGCLLAIWRDSLHLNPIYQKFLRSRIFLLILIFIIILLGFYSEKNLALFYIFGLTLMNFSIALSIDYLISNPQKITGKLLNLRPIRFVGVLSYSIYLWQQPFMFYSESRFWTHFPLNFILLILCSLFSYYFIEKTFLNYRQNIEKKYFSEKTEENILQPQTNQ